jgi:hypothetical protein
MGAKIWMMVFLRVLCQVCFIETFEEAPFFSLLGVYPGRKKIGLIKPHICHRNFTVFTPLQASCRH